MYILHDGAPATSEEIAEAFLRDKAVIVSYWNAKQGRIIDSLMLDGRHYDTRDNCCGHWWLERWTRKPGSLDELIEIANTQKGEAICQS